MHTVVETPAFIRDVSDLGVTEEERQEILAFVAANPDTGDVIPGTGGARKVRFAGRSKGKRGGYRVITFFSGPALPVFLLNVFAKNERANLTREECATLKDILGRIAAAYSSRKVSK